MTFGELDNYEFLESPNSSVLLVLIGATFPSLTHVSHSFLPDDPGNANNYFHMNWLSCKWMPILLISICLLPFFASRPGNGIRFQYTTGRQLQSKPGEIRLLYENNYKILLMCKENI